MQKKQKEKAHKAAEETIRTLFREAEATKNRKLADRYAELARKISMKAKVKLPLGFKRRICKQGLCAYGRSLEWRSSSTLKQPRSGGSLPSP